MIGSGNTLERSPAINTVFGTLNFVQRCRAHKVRNVKGYLPEHLKENM